ncbi:hypothetical protein PQJ75_08770 [Rhodoplanes sp. TEM]|uniref:PBP domain-containing protein n=1 Tax=Rhodoplanes tepidamans TaxID=200616 RepID=A0ABT5J8Q6_RHOTP|nr:MULTISPECIES: substrate-binding domain-containing protein [Rhodoplanes]MDC7786040.1 hypothetical protein [Rhodoplanes tepidamans]MDC7983819.1 hypothetical protein [Rhodoplanes sp. TEM]MDQ0354882.1 phosphate transport system substrate-binding protein [Rhodoplanes tepidamans]
MSVTGVVRGTLVAAGLLLSPSLVTPLAAAAEPVRVGGTGMALAAMRHLGDSLRAVRPDIVVEVLPSLGTSGALRALQEGAIDVAVTGRRLKAEERAKGFVETLCLRTPLLFASSHPAPGGIRAVDLPRLYSDPGPVWPDGRPLKILMRSRAGSENGYLLAFMPAMGVALEKAYGRPGVPVATTDQDNAELAQRTDGSFAVITLLQLRAEKLDLRVVALDGIQPEPGAVADTYPLWVSVCTVVKGESPPHPVAALLAHLRSETGLRLVGTMGAVPAE